MRKPSHTSANTSRLNRFDYAGSRPRTGRLCPHTNGSVAANAPRPPPARCWSICIIATRPITMRTTAFRIAGCREQRPQIFSVSFPLFYANSTCIMFRSRCGKILAYFFQIGLAFFHIADFRKIQYYFYKIRRFSGAAQG